MTFPGHESGSGKCGSCQHYSFKCVFGMEDQTQGKCFGWRDVDGVRLVKSLDTCERYKDDNHVSE